MGDVLSLIEKAEEVSDAEQAAELERKIRKQQFTLEDFLAQMRQVRKMGPLSNVLGMMPGMGKADEADAPGRTWTSASSTGSRRSSSR